LHTQRHKKFTSIKSREAHSTRQKTIHMCPRKLVCHLIMELLNRLSLILSLAALRSVFHKLKNKTYYGFIEVDNHNVGMHISCHHLLHHPCIPLFAVKLMLAALPSIMLPLFWTVGVYTDCFGSKISNFHVEPSDFICSVDKPCMLDYKNAHKWKQ